MNKSVVIEFSNLSCDELGPLGIDLGLHSSYNVKVTENGNIVGYILIQDKRINAKFKQNMLKDQQEYIYDLNKKACYNLRKIKMFSKRYDGYVENMYDYLISIMPKGYYIWSNSYWDRGTKYLLSLGFEDLPIELRIDSRIKIFKIR